MTQAPLSTMRALYSRDLAAALVSLSLGASPAFAQTSTGTSSGSDGKDTPPITFAFDDHPSLHFGDVARVDAMAKFQLDWHQLGDTGSPGAWDLHLARLGVGGQVFKVIEYQVERELNDETDPWRDVYVDARMSGALQAQGGKFKVPFSLEMLTAAMDLDFAYRSLAASSLAPGRSVGAAVHGRLFSRALRYEAGLFRDSGDNVRSSERQSPDSDSTFAARVTVVPWRGNRKSPWRTLTVGGGVTTGHLPEGLNSLNVRTIADDALLPRVYVSGSRRRFGGDVEWRNGPFGLRGEMMRVDDDRQGQGTDDNDLPALRSDGGYASATFILTGEKKADTIRPRRPAPHRGIGAIEVAGRYEWVAIGTAGSGEVSDGPRAAYLATRASRVITLGVNWYLNRFVRLQANVIHERRLEGGIAVASEQATWNPVIRFQFGL